MSYADYEMKCCELEEELRLSDIRKDQLESKINMITEALDTSHKVYDNLLEDYMKLREGLELIVNYSNPDGSEHVAFSLLNVLLIAEKTLDKDEG